MITFTRRCLTLGATALAIPTAARAKPVTEPKRPTIAPPPVPPYADASFEVLRRVTVASMDDLAAAIADGQPGDEIALQPGTYVGNVEITCHGTSDHRIMVTGTNDCVIDGDGWEHSGYGVHITGSYVVLSGVTVTNAQKGIVVDGAVNVMIHATTVHTLGHEGIHIRSGSVDARIWGNEIHHTGLDRDTFGEGIYIGSAVSNWPKYAGDEPDRCDGASIRSNLMWATSSECIDIKEGTERGHVEGNVMDGSAITGADSWIDVKGKNYVITGNHGMNSPKDGYQTHVIDDMEWGSNNTFSRNIAEVHGPGVGFYIHNPEQSRNRVECDNQVTGAEDGFSNISDLCPSSS